MGTGKFEANAFFLAVGDFLGIFSLSLFIGASMGCLTALLTKYTHIKDFPLLESALFVLMSYSTFLIAEASDLTGNHLNPSPLKGYFFSPHNAYNSRFNLSLPANLTIFKNNRIRGKY